MRLTSIASAGSCRLAWQQVWLPESSAPCRPCLHACLIDIECSINMLADYEVAGAFTNGGVDTGTGRYHFDGAFSRSAQSYCSERGSNVCLVGLLSPVRTSYHVGLPSLANPRCMLLHGVDGAFSRSGLQRARLQRVPCGPAVPFVPISRRASLVMPRGMLHYEADGTHSCCKQRYCSERGFNVCLVGLLSPVRLLVQVGLARNAMQDCMQLASPSAP